MVVVVCCRLSVVCYVFLCDAVCRLLFVWCAMCVICCLLLVVCCVGFVVCCLFFAGRGVLFVLC